MKYVFHKSRCLLRVIEQVENPRLLFLEMIKIGKPNMSLKRNIHQIIAPFMENGQCDVGNEYPTPP